MAVQLYANNAASTLASGINNSVTSLTLAAGQGALFPSPTGSDWFMLTLTQAGATETSWEIVKVTARSTDTLTIVRAQEGTSAAAWLTGAKAELRLTAGMQFSPTQVPVGSTSTTVCVGNDSRLSDSRAPSGAASGDLAGTYPSPTIKASVALTGTPTAPTAAIGDATTQLATDAFVQSAIGNAAGGQLLSPFAFRSIWFIRPSTINSSSIWISGISTSGYTPSGALSQTAITASALQTSSKRITYTSSTTTNAAAGGVSIVPIAWRGNAALLGGMYGVWRWSQETNVTGHRAFYGVSTANTLVGTSADPNTASNHLVGIGYDQGDLSSGNYSVYHGDGTTMVKTGLGGSAARDTTTVWEMVVYFNPNSSSVTVRFTNLTTGGLVLSDTSYSTNIPATTDLLYVHFGISTGTQTTPGVKNDIYLVHIETPV